MAAPLVFCEPVLAFIKAFRLRGDMNALKQAALSRFSIPMLASAKKALWESCSDDLSSLDLPFTPRRSSEKRTQAVADLEDILLAFSKLDEVDKIPLIYCEASDLVRLPPIAADPISELVIGNRACLQEIEAKISQLQDGLVSLNATSSRAEASLSFPPPPSSYAVAAREGFSSDSGTYGPKVTMISTAVNRADNLIIFGLPEVESLPALKKSVDELLSFLVGKSIPLRDLFRLGRRKKVSDSVPPGRPRPVLLKLLSTWDRRLVMSAVSKLRGFRVTSMYIREDLSPEEREKRRERSGSRKATGTVTVTGSSPSESHGALHSQSLPTQHHPLSPRHSSSSVNDSGSSLDVQ